MGDRLKSTMSAALASSTTTSAAESKAKTNTTASSSNSRGSANSRPIHPAVLTTIGPGKGSGASELSVWAYLTRPRPNTNNSGNDDDVGDDAPLPNLVTAQSNSLRVYTVLPHAGTLALTAVYDNLAGTICSLDVVPNGTSSGGCDGGECGGSCGVKENGSAPVVDVDGDNDGLQDIFADTATANTTNNNNVNNGMIANNNKTSCSCNITYDGLLLGFAGHPRLSLVYPSTPMVGGGCWSDGLKNNAAADTNIVTEDVPTDKSNPTNTGNSSSSGNNNFLTTGVGQGGVLLASSIIDLTPALIERSMGGTSYLEQDVIVTVSTSSTCASGVDLSNSGRRSNNNITTNGNDNDPSVSVVLGGGVAIASFTLPKGPRPDEVGLSSSSNNSSSSSWWRVASEPYILPLSSLSTKVRDLGSGTTSSTTNTAPSAAPNMQGGRNRNQPTPAAASTVGSGPTLSHGFGDIIDIAFLSGYTEPTLLILHSNPRKGGGRAWSGRLGRTAEVPLLSSNNDGGDGDGDDYGDDEMEIDNQKTNPKPKKTRIQATTSTGTKYGLTLTSISLSIHQHRSVVLWSLLDALPTDAWKLVPHPTNGVLVWGVNTIVYVSMGGNIRCALSVNGFGKVGCPGGLLPPPPSTSSSGSGGTASSTAVHLEPNPSPLPNLAIQLDGSRISFVTNTVAMVCLGNGTLHSLELHNDSPKMMMSLFPLGHRVGGLGLASCLSVLALACHGRCVGRFLAEEESSDGGLLSGAAAKKEEEPDSVVSKNSTGYNKPNGRRLPRTQARGMVFVGSRMGDCTLLAFSMNAPVRLVVTDVDAIDDDDEAASGGKRKSSKDVKPDSLVSSSSVGEPVRKLPKIEEEEEGKVVEILDDDTTDAAADNGNTNRDAPSSMTEEEILRLEEEELYRIDDDNNGAAATTSSIVSSSQVDSDEDGNNNLDSDQDYLEDGGTSSTSLHRPHRRSARYLSRFQSITALDSLTGLGPLGGGVYGPVATCPSLTKNNQDADDNGTMMAITPSPEAAPQASALFSSAFSSAARHYIMPCGYGASGGLAILTTPGRDNVGGSILCESDLCNMSGPIFGLPKSNLVLLGKADGVGVIVLRGVMVREEEEDEGESVVVGGGDNHKGGGYVEGFEELDIGSSYIGSSSDVLGRMTLLAASEFCSDSHCFSVFFVRDPECLENDDGPYSIVIMSQHDNDKAGEGNKELPKSNNIGLQVNFVHRIKNSNETQELLSSITPMVSKVSDDDGSNITSVTFGCVWTSGNASVFNISLLSQSMETDDSSSSLPINFEVSESVFVGDGNVKEDVSFYDSNKVVGMDVISLPNHIFDAPNNSALTAQAEEDVPVTRSSSSLSPTPDPSSSLSFPPDRLSMHGTWCTTLDGRSDEPPSPTLSQNRILVAICRRSGLLQIYDNEDTLSSPLIEYPSSPSSSNNNTLPIWEANGCSHGTSILGQSSSQPGVNSIRRPELHEVEAAEIRFFVTGPSLQPESIAAGIGAERDAWMLRSLCILVDTSLGDLHLYSGSKRRSNNNRLEFSRVPLANVSRPSDESGRHLVKLRRKGIVPSVAAAAATDDDFRPNRLHRFCGISGEDGLFAATPRPLWFVSERGAPTVVSHKSRHVSPAGGRPVPVSGFCTTMPDVFQNAKNGFVTIHERIGRVGSQRLTLYNGLWDVFAPHGLLPGSGISIQKVPLGVTVRHIEFIDDASISSTSRPVYAMLVSHEIEADQSYLNDDGLDPEERQRIRDEKEAARVRKQVEADLGGFDIEQEWVEEIEREDCFAIDTGLGLAPPMPTRKYEVWLVDASSQWNVLDKYPLKDFEHGTALKVMYLTDVVEDSDEPPERSLVIGVGTSEIDHDGEDLASKGRILLFQVKKSKKRAQSKGNKNLPLELNLESEKAMALGPVTSLSSLKSEDIYRVVVGAGAEVTVEQWGSGKLGSGKTLTQVGFYHAHMQVQEIVLFKTFFLLSDAYDSLHFLVWRESDKSLTLLAKDYEPTQVFAAGLISRGGAMSFVCHDDRQNLSFLQYAPTDAAARGGNKLVCRADFHMGSQTTSLKSHWGQSSLLFNSCTMTSTLAALKQQDTLFGRLEDDQRFAVNFGTSDGSFGSIVPLSEPTYWRLTALQSVMSNALESNCALSHRAWRLYRRSTRRAGCRSNDRKKGVIDGDVVMKFVDLPLAEQEDLASSIGSTVGLVMDNLLELGCAASVI